LFFAAITTAAEAQQAPREITTRMGALSLTCRILGGQPVRGPKPAAQPIDLTGDGRND
jgi:hypothetical protein